MDLFKALTQIDLDKHRKNLIPPQKGEKVIGSITKELFGVLCLRLELMAQLSAEESAYAHAHEAHSVMHAEMSSKRSKIITPEHEQAHEVIKSYRTKSYQANCLEIIFGNAVCLLFPGEVENGGSTSVRRGLKLAYIPPPPRPQIMVFDPMFGPTTLDAFLSDFGG